MGNTLLWGLTGAFKAIAAFDRKHIGRCMVMCGKPIVTVFQITPKVYPSGSAVAMHVLRRHAKRKDMDSEEGLAVSQGGIGQRVDGFNGRIGHGKAADGDTIAVNHQGRAGTPVVAVVCIGVS